MKKLLFVLAFTFIGQQAFSQMYMVSLQEPSHYSNNSLGCSLLHELVLIKVDPSGNQTATCITQRVDFATNSGLSVLNQEFNTIINLGYKLIMPDDVTRNLIYGQNNGGGATPDDLRLSSGHTWFFAIP